MTIQELKEKLISLVAENKELKEYKAFKEKCDAILEECGAILEDAFMPSAEEFESDVIESIEE